MSSKINIRALNHEQMIANFANLGEPKFRANQVYEWLWYKSASNFEEMTNLPKAFRDFLYENFFIYFL